MKYSEFISAVVSSIKDHLPTMYSNADVKIEPITKLGSVYDGLVVRKPGSFIAPAINMGAAFDEYCHSNDFNSVIETIGNMITSNTESEYSSFDDYAEDYSMIKDKLFIRLSNAESNRSVLKNVPHRIINDLAITYHVMVRTFDGGCASAMITESWLKVLGVSIDRLHKDAVANAPKILKPDIMCFGFVPMWIISNDSRLNGAASILYPGVLAEVSRIIGDDMYILPSSIHEVICLPASIGHTPAELAEMVRDVNSRKNCVPNGDRLSDNVYYYDSKTDAWGLADMSVSPISPERMS